MNKVRKKQLRLSILLIISFFIGCEKKEEVKQPPNFIFILTDDQGYGDVGVYGSKSFTTPNLDKMAREGTRFTSYYAAASVCTPSRASLLTGCYPLRVGLQRVLAPDSVSGMIGDAGLNPKEETIAELLKARGYATSCIGKWHLGDDPEFLPLNHGFDEYYGLPYSNDMWPNHPENEEFHFPPLPLIENDKVIETNPDQSQLTKRYTEKALRFIEKNKNNPFFLYMAHTMPHVPLFVSERFKGKSKQGLYGDVIMELDWSVGQILNKLHELNLEQQTLVIFTSDNGPWLTYGNHAGSAKPFREGKATTFDGGNREPCIMWWPKHVPKSRVCDELITSMDFLPTLVNLAGADNPKLEIDGKNIRDLILGVENSRSPYKEFYFYFREELQAVRSGKWKLHLPHKYKKVIQPGRNGLPGIEDYDQFIDLSLYNLENDPSESDNLAVVYPNLADSLQNLARSFDAQLKAHIRPAASLKNLRK